ncbi:MAG: SAM-dependent methyltransferase [Christensenellales bacterium]|jgi:cyclopropane fatty-acyl-phospholipid synthase-like methyltransferase
MKHPFTGHYDRQLLLEYMMGPNAMLICEEMADGLDIRPGMRILDLGCGMGLSSILLAGKCKAKVTAADLWIDPTDNFLRFKAQGFEDHIFPVSVDATKDIPFARGYFDMLLCIDAYHYFGSNREMLPRLAAFVRPGGTIAMAIPGLKKDFENGIPPELQPFLREDMNFYSRHWWKDLWEGESGVEVMLCRDMPCHDEAWSDWLLSPNPYARQDVEMMKAEAGLYFATIQITARVL